MTSERDRLITHWADHDPTCDCGADWTPIVVPGSDPPMLDPEAAAEVRCRREAEAEAIDTMAARAEGADRHWQDNLDRWVGDGSITPEDAEFLADVWRFRQ
jgi:hypothetical protein